MSTTLVEKLTLLPAIGLVAGKVLYATVTGPFRDRHGLAYGDHILVTLIRSFVTVLTVGQIQ